MRCEEGEGAVSELPWARKSEKQAGWIRDLSLGAGKVNPATAMFFVFFEELKTVRTKIIMVVAKTKVQCVACQRC